jgi:undecaprenyl-diphosphatase
VQGPLAVLIAIIVAVTEVLPLSGRAHASLVGVVVDAPVDAPSRAAAHLAAAIALVVFARRRIGPALGDGLSALVRPRRAAEARGAREAFGWSVATAIGVPSALFFAKIGESIAEAPLAIGVGLLSTGAMLASTSAAGRSGDDGLTPRRAIVAGLCQALSAFAGGSALAAALAALSWTGVRARRAAETAAALTFPHELALAAMALREPSATSRIAERPLPFVAAAVGALVAGVLGTARLVRVTERRLPAMGAYLLVLGAGMVAYGWALH